MIIVVKLLMVNVNYNMLGLGGVSRSGKDTLCKFLIKEYSKLGILAKRFSIADIIRDELYNFVLDKFNLNIFEVDGKDKELIRGFMIEYGLIKREQTEGKYLTDLLQKKIENDKEHQIAIITDIRYCVYPEDELFWLKNKNKGKLVHIEKIIIENNKNSYSTSILQPPNVHEKQNDPILKENSDYLIQWVGLELLKNKKDYLSGVTDDEYYSKWANNVIKNLQT